MIQSDPQATPTLPLPPAPRSGLRDLVRDPLNFFLSLTRQYGDIVCYRPAPDTAYIINHPDYVRHVLVDNHRNYSKDTYSIQVFKKVVGDGLVTSEGEAWQGQRRMMQPAFAHTRLAALEPMIVGAIQDMLDNWQHAYETNQPLDIAREMAALTLTVTSRALFGVDLGDEVREIGEWVNRAALQFEKPSRPQVQESAQAIRTIVDRIVQERRHDFSDKGDLLSSLMLAHDEQNNLKMNDAQLADQVMTLLIAGYETTANALTWTWYLLSQNPWAWDRLRSEIHNAMSGQGKGRATSLPSSLSLYIPALATMPYVRMVFDESLRLYPPAWMIGRRALGADEIGGYIVRPGTVIAVCVYTLHRNPVFWNEPDVFDPGRFSDSATRSRYKYSYIPFGAGPRQCIGNNFGLLEASLAIACIADRFELRLAPEIEVKPQPLFVLRPNRDLMMTLHH